MLRIYEGLRKASRGAVIAVIVLAGAPARAETETVDAKIVPAKVAPGTPRLFRLQGVAVLGPFRLAKGRQPLLVRWRMKAGQPYYMMLQGARDFRIAPGAPATSYQVIGVSGPKDTEAEVAQTLNVGGKYQGRSLPPGDYYLAMGVADPGCRWLVCLDGACRRAKP